MNKIKKFPAIIAMVLLLVALLSLPYGYYTFLRFVITGVAIYYAWAINELKIKKDFWFWALVVMAVLYNPIIPVYLQSKGVWSVINILTVVFFILLINKPSLKGKID
jgi:hypothetical protein